MRFIKYLILICFLGLFDICATAQTRKATSPKQWIEVLDNGDATIYYRTDITTNNKGQHVVWVKVDYRSTLYQMNFAQMIGSRTPVKATKTKALYSTDYSCVMVRQIFCYDKNGRQLYDSGDDDSAGWGYANSNDPLSVVGNFLMNKLIWNDSK